jgi:hypothetical protein
MGPKGIGFQNSERSSSSKARSIRKGEVEMNVNESADRAFMVALEVEDPQRYNRLMANTRRDDPNAGMDESQAFTNLILGLPTGKYRFSRYERPAILDEALHHGTTEDYVSAIRAVAYSNDDVFIPVPPVEVAPSSKQVRLRGGRPKLRAQQRRKSKQGRRDYMRNLMAERRSSAVSK